MGGLTPAGEEGGRRVYERLRAGERMAARFLAADREGGGGERRGPLRAFRAAGRGAVLAGASLVVSCALFCLVLVSVCLVPLGAGLVTTPPLLAVIREYALGRRERALAWGGVRIGLAYRPLPPLEAGFVGEAKLCLALLRDPATWRDIGWLLLDCTAGFLLAVLAPLVLLYPVWGAVLAAGAWRIFRDHGTEWYLFVPVNSQATGLAALALGVVIALTAHWSAPALLQAYFRLTRAALAPSREQELAARVDRLTVTREDAVDSSAAELRRIERDLHDGAQARLVAVGMDLGLVEALIERDPAKAKELLGKARLSSAEALGELRDLVRGIHPPVLAERGLVDAVRALALRLPVETEVVAEVPGRADAPVEAAAYFATSELLANAVKHAGARRIWVDLGYREGRLRISVGDDGEGGAAVAKGTGLAGVERRLGTFDGVLAVSSPPGGPTLATLELPCVLS
jgi:signal transduction histidine kinase